MSHGTITVWSNHVIVMVTRSCNAEKIIEGSETDDIIQYSKSILAL